MTITINGKQKEYKENITLGFIIDDLGIKDKIMAAALNTQIVKKDNWDNCKLSNNDKLELLQFVGGG